MQATLVSNDTTREPSTYSSVIRTSSVLKPMGFQDVTCRDEDLSRPRTTETSCLWILGPENAMSGSCLRVPELAGSSTWAISCEGGSSSPPCPRRSRVPTGSALSLTSDTSHCEVLVFLSRAAPGGLPHGVLFPSWEGFSYLLTSELGEPVERFQR